MVQENFPFEWKHFNSMDFGSYGLGASVSPMGSQLVTTNTAMNWGVNNLEITLSNEMSMQGGHLAQLGKVERDELVRLAKLNRINLSVHAPTNVDPAGIGEQGFSEAARLHAIRELKSSIDFADQIGKKSGVQNIPVVIHSAVYPLGSPNPQEKIMCVDQDSGKIMTVIPKRITCDETYLWRYGLISKDEVFNPQERERVIREMLAKGIIRTPQEAEERRRKAEEMRKKGIWDYERTKEEKRFYLTPYGELKQENKNLILGIESSIANINYHLRVNKDLQIGLMNEYEDAKRKNDQQKMAQIANELRSVINDINAYERDKERLSTMYSIYKEQFKEEVLKPTDNFAKEKIADTISDLAIYAYRKETKPMIVVENWFPESVGGNPEQVKEIIKEARNKFVEKLGKFISKEEAQKAAEQLIGMNFDVGHANLWKKYKKWDEAEGKFVEYTNEDIKKWVKEIAPYIKYVHLADNFGDMDAHLPLGWGNAPIKEILDELKKRGFGKKGERAILETFGTAGAGSFGVAESLYLTGLPLIPGGPSWEKAAGTYFESGYPFTGIPQPGGTYWPDVGGYAVGFSGLPYSTGARIGGEKEGSKFAGAPMS